MCTLIHSVNHFVNNYQKLCCIRTYTFALCYVIHTISDTLNFITSAEEGGHVFDSVCLSVCLIVCLSVGLLANLWTDYDEIYWRGRAWLKDQVIQFWWRSGSRFRSGSPKSEIRILRIGGGLCSLITSSFKFDTEYAYSVMNWLPKSLRLLQHPVIF